MIWYYLVIFITTLLTAVFSFLGKVDALPTILAVDVDVLLRTYLGFFFSFGDLIWPLFDIYRGAIYLMLYYIGSRIVLKMFLGSRAP